MSYSNRARLRAAARTWTPFERVELTAAELAQRFPFATVNAIWRNSRYVVVVLLCDTKWGRVTQLTIETRSDLTPTWDDFQRLVHEICGPAAVAVEVYPAERDVLNDEELRHLWVLPADCPLPFGLHFPDGFKWGVAG